MKELIHPSIITTLSALSLCLTFQVGSSTASGNIPLVLYEVWTTRGLTG